MNRLTLTHHLNLLPGWLETTVSVVFVVIALTHLRYMPQTGGQRRPWHACHVLMAAAMAVMYLPGGIGRSAPMVGFWQVTLASAGVLAAFWALWGAAGSVNPVWLLTALDLGAMLYMRAGHSGGAAVAWVIGAYLLGDGVLWIVDAYRRLDGGGSLIRWLPSAGYELTGVGSVASTREGRASLLGGRDLSPSMAVMTLGMAYMVIAMQLMA